jgi:hypothetical protein
MSNQPNLDEIILNQHNTTLKQRIENPYCKDTTNMYNNIIESTLEIKSTFDYTIKIEPNIKIEPIKLSRIIPDKIELITPKYELDLFDQPLVYVPEPLKMDVASVCKREISNAKLSNLFLRMDINQVNEEMDNMAEEIKQLQLKGE